MAGHNLADTPFAVQTADLSAVPSKTPRAESSNCQISRTPPPPDPKLGEAKKLFFEFLTVYFGGIEVFGVQAGFGPHKDTYLARGPFGTTLCFATNLVCEKSREELLEIVAQKVEEKRRLFEKPSSVSSSNF